MIHAICKQCGSQFVITDSEIQFYKRKGLSLPKRCQSCRNINKQKNLPSFAQLNENNEKKKRSPVIKSIVIFSIFAVIAFSFTVIAISTKNGNGSPEIKESFPDPPAHTEILKNTTIRTTKTTALTVTTTTVTATETILTTEPPVTEKTEVYYLNTFRMKFHRFDCPSVDEMNPKNRRRVETTREKLIERGYSPCQNCNP